MGQGSPQLGVYVRRPACTGPCWPVGCRVMLLPALMWPARGGAAVRKGRVELNGLWIVILVFLAAVVVVVMFMRLSVRRRL
eukprot:14688892-Heterocapsa_arctica.AAC.1